MALLEILRSRVEHFLPFISVIALALFTCQICSWIYNVYFHPLRKFPGPKHYAASAIPYVVSQLRGELQHRILELHEEYGEVVRVLPNELSFSSADAWKDIYGHRKGGQPVFPKFDQFYAHPFNADGVQDIVGSDDATHSRMRRVFANAFSDRALKLQEPLFLTYVDRLIQNLLDTIAKEPKHIFDMVMMYNFTTFDVMGDLTFGEPLNLLENDTFHGWVRNMFANFKFGAYVHSIRYYPALESLLLGLLRYTPLDKMREEHNQFSSSRVDRRLEKTNARPDIWGLVLARDEENGMSKPEMYKNAGLFMIAGTETTATLLSGLTYHLLKNPEKMKKLVEEIRSNFEEEGELTIEKLQALPYLHACIEEGLRMYPPVSNGLPRVIPSTGGVVDGRDVPAGTVVYSHHIATYRNPKNFRDAYKFVPERWIDDEYSSDLKHALNPFSIGPRACLGKNMAYHEIRIILAKVLWNFDLELCPETGNWADTKKIYVLWSKGPLYCTLKSVR